MKITGILTNWRMYDGRIHGQIVADYSNRFEYKEYITTSPIDRIDMIQLNGSGIRIAKTKNSTYILVD